MISKGAKGLVPWTCAAWHGDPNETKFQWTSGYFNDSNSIISLAKNGVLIRRLDRQNLFNLLEGDMVPPAVEEKKRPFWRRKHEKQHE